MMKRLFVASIAPLLLGAQAQGPDPTLASPQAGPPACALSPEDAEGGEKLSQFCLLLDHRDSWSLVREESPTHDQVGIVDTTLIRRAGDTGVEYKILLWPAGSPHDYAREEPLTTIPINLERGVTLDSAGPQYLRLSERELLVYVPLAIQAGADSQPSMIYRVDVSSGTVLQAMELPACPVSKTCLDQTIYLMYSRRSPEVWILHSWRFTNNYHQTTTFLYDGHVISEGPIPTGLLGNTWVGVEFKDDLGRPQVRERYVVALPRLRGWTVEGCLNAQGQARLQDVFPGMVDVSFPEEDDGNWRAVKRPKPHRKRIRKGKQLS